MKEQLIEFGNWLRIVTIIDGKEPEYLYRQDSSRRTISEMVDIFLSENPQIERYHILPINDTIDHIEDEICQCKPVIKTQPNGNILIVHNSFDGREGLEMAKKLLD